MPLVSRRGLLSATGLVLSALALPKGALAREKPLRDRAAEKGLLFGCAVSSNRLAADPAFARAVARDELKREVVQREKGVLDFAPRRRHSRFRPGAWPIVATLVWHLGMPPWLRQELKDNPSEAPLTGAIAEIFRRYPKRMHSWDVVNEVINPEDGHPKGLRTSSPWFQPSEKTTSPRRCAPHGSPEN